MQLYLDIVTEAEEAAFIVFMVAIVLAIAVTATRDQRRKDAIVEVGGWPGLQDTRLRVAARVLSQPTARVPFPVLFLVSFCFWEKG